MSSMDGEVIYFGIIEGFLTIELGGSSAWNGAKIPL